MNHTLELPGLHEDMARDFLAAIGLLRLLDLKWLEIAPKLSWNGDEGFPVIHCDVLPPADWFQQLISDIQFLEQDPNSPLFHGEVIKAEYGVFRAAVIKAIRFKHAERPLAALPELMFAAYGGQLPDPKTGSTETSMLSFANGQGGKSLLRDVRELVRVWDASETTAALDGHGKPSAAKSFRWAPQEYRPAAHRAHDPGANVKGDGTLDFPGFNVLAFFGLSCIPSLSTAAGCVTTAFTRDESGWYFHWPVWTHPLSISEVVALVGAEWSIVGSISEVIRVWKSRRLVAEKSVYFAPSTLA